jgi:hypothetical protein
VGPKMGHGRLLQHRHGLHRRVTPRRPLRAGLSLPRAEPPPFAGSARTTAPAASARTSSPASPTSAAEAPTRALAPARELHRVSGAPSGDGRYSMSTTRKQNRPLTQKYGFCNVAQTYHFCIVMRYF